MRLAKRLPEIERSNSFRTNLGKKVTLYVDTEFEDELFAFLGDKKNEKIKKKYRMIAELVVTGNANPSLYGHEQNSDKSKDVYAFKIKINGNHRIYCKEFNDDSMNSKKIVLIEYKYKKTEGLNKELRNLVDKIGEYEYEFQE